MTAAGIDLGGTKIEVRVFDGDWQEVARKRLSTPDSYEDLIGALASLVAFADAQAGEPVRVGLGTAGVVHERDGTVFAINLPVIGKPFAADLRIATGRDIPVMNDARAMVLSEAVFGAGAGAAVVAGVILGTGLGGGFVRDGALLPSPLGVGGEIGHMAAPAHVVVDAGLPVFECNCGRRGCIEAYVSGPGLSRLAAHLLGQDMTPHEVTRARRGEAAPVWQVWCAMMAEVLRGLSLSVDPDVIVLAGGLSRVEGLLDDLRAAGADRPFDTIGPVDLRIATGGDSSGALGAAYAASRMGVT